MKAFKPFIKPFDAPQRSVKMKGFFSLSGIIGMGRVKKGGSTPFSEFLVGCGLEGGGRLFENQTAKVILKSRLATSK